jgi:hypothetical protein
MGGGGCFNGDQGPGTREMGIESPFFGRWSFFHCAPGEGYFLQPRFDFAQGWLCGGADALARHGVRGIPGPMGHPAGVRSGPTGRWIDAGPLTQGFTLGYFRALPPGELAAEGSWSPRSPNARDLGHPARKECDTI